jgi:glycerophosphoryl diester phosphodiesterase
LIAWGVATSLLSTIPLAVAGTIGRAVAPPFSENVGALVIIVGGVLLTWGALNLLVSVISIAALALLTVRLYNSSSSSQEAQTSKELQMDRLESQTRRLIPRKTLLIALLVAFVAASAVGFVLMQRVRMDDDVVVIAHRGAAGRAPENTLASVAAAIEDGADFVEIDVQETLDGRVIVIHDADFMRVGNNPLRVWDGTFEEIRQIDIGSWFGPAFVGQHPPTLEEVLEMCRDKAHVVIELKYYGHDQQLEQRVVNIVEDAGMADQIEVMSLKAEAVQTMKSLRPRWKVGLLTAKAVGDLTTTESDFLAVHSGIATNAFVRRAHAAGKDVYAWTVNDRRNMFRMMTAGVDGLITDEPAAARQVIETRAELSSGERLLVAAALWMGLEFDDPPPERDLN